MLLKKLESFNRKYKIAGNNKSQKYFLVYGGGSVFALALGIELRKAAGNKKGIENFMKLYV